MRVKHRNPITTALRWTGTNFDEIASVFGLPAYPHQVARVGDTTALVVAYSGSDSNLQMLAYPGDWIVRGDLLGLFVVKADRFDEEFELL